MSLSIQSITDHHFTVTEEPLVNYKGILTLSTKWIELAKEKMKTAKCSNESFEHLILVLEGIQANIRLNQEMYEGFCQLFQSNALFVCRNEQSFIEGIGIFAKRDREIVWLASHPKNLPHPIYDASRVHGVGTTMIQHFAAITLKQGMSLSVIPKNTAVGFYKKLGFEWKTETTMHLTSAKIEALLKRTHR